MQIRLLTLLCIFAGVLHGADLFRIAQASRALRLKLRPI